MSTKTSNSKAAKAFEEIPGESVTDRRLRYWNWKRVQAKIEGKRVRYGLNIPDGRKTTISHLTRKLRDLTHQVEVMAKALAKAGIKMPLED